MVRGLGRSYEQLFEALERLGRFPDTTHGFEVWLVLSVVKNVSNYFELVHPDTAKYFERADKAWTLGDMINDVAGVPRNLVAK
jgi:hypothetical protein